MIIDAKENLVVPVVQPTTTEETKEANGNDNIASEQVEETQMEVDKVDKSLEDQNQEELEIASQKEAKEKDATSDETNVSKTKDINKTSRPQHDESIPLYAGKNHKFNVKVVLIQFPQIVDIYEKLFGSDFDAINSIGKSKLVHFNKAISMLLTKNSNDGYSLIGGKFVRHLDGLLPNGEPNLIGTAVRAVKEQTGLNLSGCKEWKGFASFVYNK